MWVNENKTTQMELFDGISTLNLKLNNKEFEIPKKLTESRKETDAKLTEFGLACRIESNWFTYDSTTWLNTLIRRFELKLNDKYVRQYKHENSCKCIRMVSVYVSLAVNSVRAEAFNCVHSHSVKERESSLLDCSSNTLPIGFLGREMFLSIYINNNSDEIDRSVNRMLILNEVFCRVGAQIHRHISRSRTVTFEWDKNHAYRIACFIASCSSLLSMLIPWTQTSTVIQLTAWLCEKQKHSVHVVLRTKWHIRIWKRSSTFFFRQRQELRLKVIVKHKIDSNKLGFKWNLAKNKNVQHLWIPLWK